VANIAGFLALPRYTIAKITSDVTAVYHNGQNLYITDNSGSLLAYSSEISGIDVVNGALISNAVAKLDLYGNSPQAISPISWGNVVDGTPVEPTIFNMADATTADHAKYVKVEDVQFTASGTFATSGAEKNANLTDGNVVRNNFNFEDISYDASKHYDITGFINYYNDALQLYFIKIVEHDGDAVELVKVDNFNYFIENGVLNILCADNQNVTIYNTLGQMIESVVSKNGITQISNLPKNQIVVVKVGNYAERIIIK
jgi:hypothetical protein